jgi:hypothetical protein
MTIPFLLFGNNSNILIRIQTKLLKKPSLFFFKKKIKLNIYCPIIGERIECHFKRIEQTKKFN